MRLLEVIKAPFDKGAAIPILLEGKEAISALFEFQLRVLCTERSLAANDVLGQSLTVAISDEGAAEPRKVNGVVRSFKAFGRAESGLLLYEFNLVPSFWLMTLVENCRIFQDKNAVEVIDEVLSAYSGAINAKIDISPTPPKRDYCVQYNESDFDFISRILTEEGACYFVKYSDTSGGRYDQELVIGNSGSSYFSCVQQNLESRQGDFYDNAVTNWRAGHSMHASEWRLNDYNPMTASQDLEVSAQSTSSVHSPFSSERYRAHGRFLDRARGEALVGIHQDCEERLSEFFEGASRYVHFAPGATSDFTTAPDDVDAERFVFVSVTHYVRDESGTAAHLSNEGEEAALEPIEYRNEFLAIPSTKVFRPPEEIRRLRMKGLHTGVVVGKENDDINTDEHGRIRVHFHWDRGGKGKEAPTCWLRVAQTFAGNGFGSQFIPRVGMEVLIDFVEEDPDRPIVVGCVYNSDSKMPFQLPENKTQSGLRTISSPPGEDKRKNELYFEDRSGEEEVYFHAGRDFTRIVRQNDVLKVGNTQEREIKADRSVLINKGTDTLKIEEGDRSVELNSGANSLKLANGDYKVAVDNGAYSFDLEKDYELNIASGNQATKLAAGASTLEAAKKIELKVGSTVVTLDPAGITIKAAQIKLQASAIAEIKGAMVKVKASGMAQVESPMTKVSGAGMLMLKGGLVMIN